METAQLAALERIANNLPVLPGQLQHGFIPTPAGDIYLAWGRAADQQWHGVACFAWNRRQVAVTSEHGWALSSDQVRDRMFGFAHANAKLFLERGLHRDDGVGGLGGA